LQFPTIGVVLGTGVNEEGKGVFRINPVKAPNDSVHLQPPSAPPEGRKDICRRLTGATASWGTPKPATKPFFLCGVSNVEISDQQLSVDLKLTG
jgi:hypothetical protein